MGNSCNKVTPIVCTARVTCTMPIWCATSPPDAKVHPLVVEPIPKWQLQSKTEPAVQETPRGNASPRALPSPETPNDRAKPNLTLDPIQPFQQTESFSPGFAPQRVESVATVEAEPANDDAATPSIAAVASKPAREHAQAEICNVEPAELEKDPQRPAEKQPVPSPAVTAAKEIVAGDEDPQESSTGEHGRGDAQDDMTQSGSETDDDDVDRSSKDSTSETGGPEVDDPGSEDNEDNWQSDASETDTSSEESSEDMEPFTFESEALVALEHFQLQDKLGPLTTLRAGRAIVQVLKSICTNALDTGAASQNCQIILSQIKIIIRVLSRAQEKCSRRFVKSLLAQLYPILASTETVIGSWSHKGTMAKFTAGRASDDEFLELHLQLKEFAQSTAFMKLISYLPSEEATQFTTQQAAQQLSGYCSVEANRVAFERLLLLFILRYKPTKTRTQKQRLMDLLAAYGNKGFGCETVEEQIEHMAKTRLSRAATHAVPLMVVLMTNMWGASMADVPRSRTEKWRMAVRMALEPLRSATGVHQLPQVPEDDVQAWEELEDGAR